VKIKLREKRIKMRNVNREHLSINKLALLCLSTEHSAQDVAFFQAKKLQAINNHYDLGIL